MEQYSNLPKRLNFIEFFPVSLFGGVMGLSGLCFSWRLACGLWNLNRLIGETIGGASILSFVVLTIAYLIKCFRYPSLVRQEFANPASVSFFATFIISLLLIPGILLPYSPLIAAGMWSLATVLMFIFAWYVLRKWIDNQQLPENVMPAWILPIVGTLDVPIIGTKLQLPGIQEACLIFFGIGIVFTLLLMTIIFSRLLFQNQLSEALQPTLLILVGPFALAFTGYEGLSGNQDIVAGVFFYFDLFLLLLLGSKIAYLPVSCPFRVSWWSVSFPLSAITIAAFHYEEHKHDAIHQVLAGMLLGVTTVVILYLFAQTIFQIMKGTFNSSANPIIKTPTITSI
jgi:tellurite resistance protein